MAKRNFVVRHGKLVNASHLDQDYPYRYQGDPIRYLAIEKKQRSDKLAKIQIAEGIAEYFDR